MFLKQHRIEEKVVLAIQDIVKKMNLVPAEIFRAYDIRGIVGETLTLLGVEAIGRALASVVLAAGEKSIVVACDGRLSGPSLKAALAKGIQSTGCDVVDIGMVPTPVLYFATHHLKIPSGVMITGSHNPPEYNGLKMVVSGKALYGQGILALYDKIQSGLYRRGTGAYFHQEIDAIYQAAIQKDIGVLRRLKIVVDCGNGVPGNIAPLLYRALGCEVIPLYCEVDGTFPNHHPDPGQPKNLEALIATVKKEKADLGLAFDGDGDRLGLVDNQGMIIWPDRQLILFAKTLLIDNPHAKIIFDVKCSRHVALEIKKAGGEPMMWKTGHSLIKAKIQETGALLAGEMSGHLFFNDRWFGFDDALYAGARALSIFSAHYPQKTVAEIFSALPDSVNTPELILPVTEADKFKIIDRLIALADFDEAVISTMDGLRIDFSDGFGLVRASNTGPNLILRFEGDTVHALQSIQMKFRQLLQVVLPEAELPFS